MPLLLPHIVDQIESSELKYGKKLRAQLEARPPVFHERAERYLACYEAFLASRGQSIGFGIACYLKLRRSMLAERVHFLRTGAYRSSSFEEVNQRVYANPDAMEYHMHGLALAQFLWPEQYRRFEFFSDTLPKYADCIDAYLEVGGGHALYIMEALRLLKPATDFELVDVSPHSMELAKGIAQDPRVYFHLMDIFDYRGKRQFDFITMGEVLEHVEQPVELLQALRDLLKPEGRAFISTPVNAPTLDHIYLFRNVDEIRATLREGGFEIEQETQQYGEDVSQEKAEELKIALMYAAFVRKR